MDRKVLEKLNYHGNQTWTREHMLLLVWYLERTLLPVLYLYLIVGERKQLGRENRRNNN